MRSLISILLLACVVLSARSQTFVKQDAAGNNDGTSWEDAYSDLQAALEQSIAGDQLWIAAGTYKPNGPTPDSSHFVVDKAIELYGGFSGTEGALEERDWETYLTILSGDINGDDVTGDFLTKREDNAHHIVMVQTLSGIPLIDGFILEGGTTRLDDLPPLGSDRSPWEGGAMFVTSELTLINCTFRDNNGYRGAALDASFPDSTIHNLIIENCLFVSNSSVQGAVRLVNLPSPVVRRCTFRNNQASDFGAAMVIGNANMIVEDCLFEMNVSETWGGAIAVFQNTASNINPSSVRLANTTFQTNSCSSFGGALAVQNFSPGAKLIIDSCKFINNIGANATTGQGGAIRVYNIPSSGSTESPTIFVSINTTEFTENNARFGSAVLCWSDDDSMTVNIANSKFTNNEASTGGAGLYIFNRETAKVFVSLKSVDFDGNIADIRGAGISFDNSNNLNKIHFALDSCSFKNNVASSYGGAIVSNGSIGSVVNSEFIDNIGLSSSGAVDSGGDSLIIENSLFSGNFTKGDFVGYEGGGAVLGWNETELSVKNTVYTENISDAEGAAIFLTEDSQGNFENVLFNNHNGNSTILNRANLTLQNVTMIDNELGLSQQELGYAEIQNTILNNVYFNYVGNSSQTVVSYGGNISNDNSMIDLLKGYGDYEDLHDTDPALDMNFVPMEDSPCVDAGNPEGMTTDYDLAGEDRVRGNAIDLGAYESPFMTVAVRDIAWNSPELNVFPNPVTQNLQFRIEDDWTGILDISIYDLLGRKVFGSKQSKTNGEQLFLENISHLATGEYVLLVSSADDTYASKIVVQN
jgi:predicted outer membrane repeat protein